jgi:GNAT superfamily N-acetyltransferase
MFLSTYTRERRFKPDRWRAEFGRGDWHLCRLGRRRVGLLGITREPQDPAELRYFEYMWVVRRFRGNGVARYMLESALAQLRANGIRTVRLWVLDGNDVAVRLYEQVGFVRNGQVQKIADRPGRYEEQMVLTLP